MSMTMLLFLGILCFQLLPELITTVIFCIVQHSLSVFLVQAIKTVSIAGGLFLMIWAVQWKRTDLRKRLLTGFFGLMPALCTYLLVGLFYEYLLPFVIAFYLKNLILGIGATVLVFFLVFMFEGYSFYVFVSKCCEKKHPFRSFMRRIYLGVPAALMVGFIHVVADVVYLDQSVSLHFLGYILSALIIMALLYAAIALMNKMLKNAKEDENVSGKVKFPVTSIVFGTIALLILGFRGYQLGSVSTVDRVTDKVNAHLEAMEIDMLSGDLEGALQELQYAQETLAIWTNIAEIEENNSLDEAYTARGTDPYLLYLTAVRDKDVSRIENYLKAYRKNQELSLALLEMYSDRDYKDSMHENTDAYKKMAVADCIAAGYYTLALPQSEVFEEEYMELIRKLDDYAQLEQLYHMLILLQFDSQNTALNKQTMAEVIALAEEYPDEMMIQYLVAKIGSGWTYDEADHYEATGEAAMRYLRLYIKQNEPEEAELITLNISVAQMLMECYQYEKALECLTSVTVSDTTGNAIVMAIKCYEALDMQEECYETVEAYVKEYPDDAYALYYGAVSTLKLGKYDEMLEFTLKIASLLQECDDRDERIVLDTYLYSLLQYISFDDDSRYTGYQYAFYNELNEEQWEQIHKNEFLENYLNAVYNCFRGDSQEALDLVEDILKDNEDLPFAWYLKGAILYGTLEKDNFQKAVDAYKKSLEYMPDNATVWYALANAYDGLEEYELAIEACERALALLPEQDHGNDWYGVSYHGKKLLRALEAEVK